MGFKELLKDSVTEVFTYRTTKLVKTNDKFLVTLHFIFMSLIATFALVSILLSHNYMLFELPALYVTTTYQELRTGSGDEQRGAGAVKSRRMRLWIIVTQGT